MNGRLSEASAANFKLKYQSPLIFEQVRRLNKKDKASTKYLNKVIKHWNITDEILKKKKSNLNAI